MKKKTLSLLLVLFISLFSFSNVYALKVVEAGDNVVHEGEYDSTKFVAGYKVINRATVNGISFVAGNELELEGNSVYGFYAGNTLSIGEQVEKDLFAAGSGINFLENASVGRDAYIAASSVKVSGTIGRDLRIGSMTANLSGAKISGDAYVASSVIVLDENTVISGKLIYDEEANITGLDVATVGSVETKAFSHDTTVVYNPMSSVYSFIISAVAGFIVLLVLFYLSPKVKDRLDKLKFDGGTLFTTLLYGLAVLFLLPIVAIIALFTGFLTPLALIFLAMYAISIYLGFLLSYYVVGRLLMKKLFKNDSVYLAMALGIVLIKLLILVPLVGGFVTLACLLYGLGLIFNYIKDRKK